MNFDLLLSPHGAKAKGQSSCILIFRNHCILIFRNHCILIFRFYCSVIFRSHTYLCIEKKTIILSKTIVLFTNCLPIGEFKQCVMLYLSECYVHLFKCLGRTTKKQPNPLLTNKLMRVFCFKLSIWLSFNENVQHKGVI